MTDGAVTKLDQIYIYMYTVHIDKISGFLDIVVTVYLQHNERFVKGERFGQTSI